MAAIWMSVRQTAYVDQLLVFSRSAQSTALPPLTGLVLTYVKLTALAGQVPTIRSARLTAKPRAHRRRAVIGGRSIYGGSLLYLLSSSSSAASSLPVAWACSPVAGCSRSSTSEGKNGKQPKSRRLIAPPDQLLHLYLSLRSRDQDFYATG